VTGWVLVTGMGLGLAMGWDLGWAMVMVRGLAAG
jgi:hypothetical protein